MKTYTLTNENWYRGQGSDESYIVPEIERLRQPLASGSAPAARPAVEPMPKIEVGDVIIMEGHGRPMAALVVESDDIEYTVQHQEFAERVSQRRVHGVARVIWRREG